MSVAYLRPMTEEDAYALGPRLRACDVQEIADTGDTSPIEHLSNARRVSYPAWAWVHRRSGRVLACCGVQPLPVETADADRLGHAWILSAAEVWDGTTGVRPVDFHRATRDGLEIVESIYDGVLAASGASLDHHHRWLERLGFVQYGSNSTGTLTYFVRRFDEPLPTKGAA